MPPSRKRKTREEDDDSLEESASGSGEETTTKSKRVAKSKTKKPPTKRARKGIEISVQERETLVSNIVRFLLFKHASKAPIRKRELMDAAIKKTHGSKAGLLDALFEEAQKRLRHLFGMEAVPVPRVIPPGDGPVLFRVPVEEETIGETKAKKKAKPDMWIVRMAQKPDEHDPPLEESEVYTRAWELNHKSDDAPQMGLLMVIYSLIQCSRDRLNESELWECLSEFGIEKGHDHSTFGKVELLLETFTKELYLSKIKDEEGSRDATDRNGVRTTIYYYTFGPRLHSEMHPSHVTEFLTHITETPAPDTIKRHIEKYNLWHAENGDEEENGMATTQPATHAATQGAPSQQVHDLDDFDEE